MFELKPLSIESIPAAQQKAVRYRLLNEPQEAESICLDILQIDPGNRDAVITLILALTDQFDQRLGPAARDARQALSQLENSYETAYYRGIIAERQGKAYFKRGAPGSGSMAYDAIRDAMEAYEEAETLRPAGNDDAILRWNSCVRMLERYPEIKPAEEEPYQPMLE